ncbi:MAG: extracellular solute-binding protein [Chloroflexaceae bacterium]|jgi:multiple sugar transport system substrate-binding protein|nr:extracellular solute-binding protein [Chloroflexaceae bacterium]
MRHRRSLILAVLLGLLVPLIAACGGGTPAAAPTAAPAAGATAAPAPVAGGGGTMEVEPNAVLRVTSWGDAAEQKINTDSFARFNALYPNVKIEYQPQASDYQTKLKADAAGNTLADVFYLDSGLMTAFGPENILLDLTPGLQAGGVTLDSYAPALLQLFQRDGKTYGLPKDFNPLVLFINNEKAQAAGVDPTSITTWEAWRDAATKMTTGEGNSKVFGMCMQADAQRFGALMLQQGINIVDGKTVNFTDPKAIEAVNFWYSFYKDGHGQLPKELGADWCGQAFGEGKVGMTLEGGWMVPYLAKDFNDVQYTALALPTPPNGDRSSLLFTNAWAASAKTAYPKAAAALVLFLTSPENQRPILDVGFALPTHNTVLKDPAAQSNPTTKVLLQAAEYGKVSDIAFGGAAKDDVLKALNTNVEAAFLGQAELSKALETAQAEAQAALNK